MGGAGLPFGLMFLVLMAIFVMFAVYVVIPWMRNDTRERARLSDPRNESLVYEVPEGRDPAPIIAALHKDGLEATEVMRHGRQRIVISCSSGRELLRSRARAAIAREADLNYAGDPASLQEVTFADE